MHKGLITSLSLHIIKYLIDLFIAYGSSLETISLTSMSSILNIFLLCVKIFFF